MPTLPLAQAAALYDVPDSALRLMRGGQYTYVFQFFKKEREYILRLIPLSEDLDYPNLKATVAWLQHLVRGGALVPEPVATTRGAFVESIIHESREWLVMAVTVAHGTPAENLGLDRWDAALYQELGRTVGAVHALSRKFVPPGGLRRPDWDETVNLFNHPAPEHEWLARKQAAILDRIHKLPRGGEDYGMIHADLHFGNFIIDFSETCITLVDLDDCAFGWYVMDLAMLLFDVLVLHEGADREEFTLRFMANLLSGYQEKSPLPRFWIEQIPLFLKLLEINLYADLLYMEKTEGLDPWVAKFLPGRREKIEQDIPYVEIDFDRLLSMRVEVISAAKPSAPKPVQVKRTKAPGPQRTGRTQSRQRGYSFWREFRTLIAMKLYIASQISADRAARVAGVSTIEFLLMMGFYNIFPLEAELTELERLYA